jgi:hypothetical protein|tara:strand:- start:356 stop:1234 length:879 start_codon:yes stop_codon:yes gene_type:complete
MKFGIREIFFGRKMKKNNPNNKILTGIPRSGTTLACRLLSQMPDVIALNEPLEPSQFPNRKDSLTNIRHNFDTFRKRLHKNGNAIARNKAGQLIDNAYDSSGEKRKMILQRSEVHFDKKLSPDFDLIFKHNAGFSLLLPEILDIFPCYAMIRNPIAVLGSWRSVNVPVSRGRVAKSKKLLPTFFSGIEDKENLLEKQLFILSWYFEQYTALPNTHIVRYEEMIRSNGQVLQNLTSGNQVLNEELKSKNHNPLYDDNLILQLGERLLKSEGAYWEFYDKSEVEKLLETYLNEQ